MANSTTNRITYLEPNNLPKEFAAKSANNSILDNITWAPEDLNITVDLQVVIPSRKYRKSNANIDYNDALLNKQSIFSGVVLDPKKNGETFLTTDYTNVGYQEIKNNNAGSKELLGINSIHITFDSHMYPRVSMNFTDVRGSSLMMPQEQYTYDMAENKITGKNNPVCESFFQSFFKFPYPQFLLSVKGIYGTCVTFVLSVEDFKATFNSDTGNFDVVVTFIGLMYGLYTDIPMNYLMLAPYIGSSNDNITNRYWSSKAVDGGEFCFHEKDGNQRAISTFFEFANNYKDLISVEQAKTGFLYGPNIGEIANNSKKIARLEKLKEYFRDIKNNIKNPSGNKIDVYEVYVEGVHVLFFVCENPVTSVSFNSGFVKNFSDELKNCEDDNGTLIENKDDVPGKLSHYNETVDTVYVGYKNIFIPSKNGKYVFDRENNSFLKKLEEYGNNIVSKVEESLSKEFENAKCGLIYDDKFETTITNKIGELNDRSNSLEENATSEMVEVFKQSCGFTPTIENVMRMIFAHLDTFLHEFYTVLESISTKTRRFGKEVNWDKSETDVMSSSNDSEVPPFPAFYSKNKDGHYERTYPSPKLKDLDEILFVEEILNGITNKLKSEAIKAEARLEGNLPTNLATETSYDFTPIAITDYFYSTSPYSEINTEHLETINDILYFILCRIYVGFREFKYKINDKERNEIVDREIINLKNSSAWNYLLANKEKLKGTIENFNKAITEKQDWKIFEIEVEPYKSYTIKKQKDGEDYFKFNGLNKLPGGTIVRSREKLERRFYIENNDKIESFKNSCTNCLKGKDKYDKSTRIDSDSFLRRKPEKGKTSILIPINNEGVPYNEGEWKGEKWYRLPDETNIKFSDEELSLSIEELIGRTENIWVPAIFDKWTLLKGSKNIFFDKKNVLFNEKATIGAKAAWFLANLLYYEKADLDLDLSHDHFFHLQKAVLYLIGAYCDFKDKELIKADKAALAYVEKFVKKFYPDFLTTDDGKTLKKMFSDWVVTKFDGNNGILQLLLNEINSYNDKNKPIAIAAYTEGLNSNLSFFDGLKPNTTLQNLLIELINDDCYVLSLPKSKNEEKKETELLKIDAKYFKNIFDGLKSEVKEEGDSNEVEESSTATNIPINGSDDNLKNSLYYTLKNIYDRWLPLYSYENFKLDAPGVKRDRSAKFHSEFSNFLYVDSFYNDISTDFMINPKNLFNLVNDQIAGNTNFNILDFIGKLCQDNKLLFRCLPVYDSLYSADTFKNIFRPLSLYNGADKLYRRIGNTYLIMYPYEPSNKLNLLQDKTNDVAYQYDSFNFADSFGRITEEASNLYGEGKGENICAFGVTPGAQNQSYFTKVSIGMDNPRVTDYAIRNKFALAHSSVGGRSEAEGAAQDLYSIYSNRSYDCNVEMLGCANIMPMMYFQLNNVPMFNGAYMITKVEHDIQNNTMTTKFTGTRMSRYYIPYNKSLFALQELFEIINRLPGEGGGYVTLAGIPIKMYSKNGEMVELKREQRSDIPQPKKDFSYNRNFNVWAAVNQMAQCTKYSFNDIYVPLNYNHSEKVKVDSSGHCATAVEMFLMAGFHGVFAANNYAQGGEVDTFRSSKTVYGVNFTGPDGYDMKQKLAELGFVCIAAGADEMDRMDKNGLFQSGDVCVMRYKTGKYGHVCMYSGTKWVSDYSQNSWRDNSDVSKSRIDYSDPSAVLLYRYPKVESTPQVYCYYNTSSIASRVDNYMDNNGYVENVDMLRYKNVVE